MKKSIIGMLGGLLSDKSAMEKFEQAYREAEERERKNSDNFFDINAKDASEMARTNRYIPEYDKEYLEKIMDRIVGELCEKTYGIRVRNGVVSELQPKKIGGHQKDVTVEDLEKIPVHIRPQLTGTLQHNDLNGSSGEHLAEEYKKYLQETDPKKKRFLYGHFRQGMDILDIDPLLYELLGRNRNNMGYWLPQVTYTATKHGFFKIPDTVLIKVPPTVLQMTRLEYMSLNPATLKIIDDWAMHVFELDVQKEYFVKTGIFSSKFDFRNAKISGEKEVKELGEYLIFIQNYATSLAGPLVVDGEGKPASHYGAATTNEFAVREFITDKEDNPCIYNGMPLHTEYRVFIEFFGNGEFEILGISPYWRKDVMLQRFSQGPDKDTAKMRHDFLIYTAHEKTLYKRYNENAEKVLINIAEMAPDIKLTGQWSLDVMQNGDDFYIIDMAEAAQSALQDCVPAGRIRKMKECWFPESIERTMLEEKMSKTPDIKGEKMRDRTKDFEQAMDKIRNIMANTVSERDRAEKELELFRTEKWKDEELQKMKRERDEAVRAALRGFPISEKEHIAIRKWMEEHMRTQHNAAATKGNTKISAVGREFEYRFTPTEIGPFGSVVCTSCMRKVVKKVYSKAANIADPAGEDMRKIREDIRRYTKEFDAEFEFQIP